MFMVCTRFVIFVYYTVINFKSLKKIRKEEVVTEAVVLDFKKEIGSQESLISLYPNT